MELEVIAYKYRSQINLLGRIVLTANINQGAPLLILNLDGSLPLMLQHLVPALGIADNIIQPHQLFGQFDLLFVLILQILIPITFPYL